MHESLDIDLQGKLTGYDQCRYRHGIAPVIQAAGSIWVYRCVLSDLLRSLRLFWMCLVSQAFGIAIILLLMDKQSQSYHDCCSCLTVSIIKSCFHLIIIYHSIWAKNAYIRDLGLDGFDGKFLQRVCTELGKKLSYKWLKATLPF